VYSYHPVTRTTRLESERTNKLLMRRYAAMQKARDADVFGILVGTLGIGDSFCHRCAWTLIDPQFSAHYLPLIAHIRNIMSRKRKKCYTISVGKLNPAKLANFMEIECFVIVACPENSIVESKVVLMVNSEPFSLFKQIGRNSSSLSSHHTSSRLRFSLNNAGRDDMCSTLANC